MVKIRYVNEKAPVPPGLFFIRNQSGVPGLDCEGNELIVGALEGLIVDGLDFSFCVELNAAHLTNGIAVGASDAEAVESVDAGDVAIGVDNEAAAATNF